MCECTRATIELLRYALVDAQTFISEVEVLYSEKYTHCQPRILAMIAETLSKTTALKPVNKACEAAKT